MRVCLRNWQRTFFATEGKSAQNIFIFLLRDMLAFDAMRTIGTDDVRNIITCVVVVTFYFSSQIKRALTAQYYDGDGKKDNKEKVNSANISHGRKHD